MIPIYFPFTYVPGWVAEALAVCFKHFFVYQPSGRKLPDEMQRWVEAKIMQVRVSVQEDDQVLDAVVKDFRAFASLHHDRKELRTAASLGSNRFIPFFGETATSRIVADVKKSSQAESAETNFDPLFSARVFLDFALEFDRQSDELNQDMILCDRRAHDLLKDLKGENDELQSPQTLLATDIQKNDPGQYKALGRLQAWSQLFLEDPVGTGLFVTSSKSVLNHLIEQLPEVETITQSGKLPTFEIKDSEFRTWRDDLLNLFQQLVETDWSATQTSPPKSAEVPITGNDLSNVKLSVYLMRDLKPCDLFSQFIEVQHAAKSNSDQTIKLKNTLIGLIECHPDQE